MALLLLLFVLLLLLLLLLLEEEEEVSLSWKLQGIQIILLKRIT